MPRNERASRFSSETTDDKQRALLSRLEHQLAAVHDSDSFRAYLRVQSRFHTYSFGNALLIQSQRPDATRVAGYRTWQSLGRQVRKGETGLRIIVPMPIKFENQHDDAETKLRFGIGHVFDVGQTEGEALVSGPEAPILTGPEGEELYAHLARLASDEGVTLFERERFNPESAMGFYRPDTKLITVRPAAQAQMTKTLAHEAAHHFTGMHETYSEQRAEHETVAEAVAFVVCTKFGLDTAVRSVPYIAAWSQNKERFRSVLGTIQGVSSHIIGRLEAYRDETPVPDAQAQPVPPPPAPAA